MEKQPIIIPPKERKEIKDLRLAENSYIMLPTTTISNHFFHDYIENDYSGVVKPFTKMVKIGNLYTPKIGLYFKGKILTEPIFDVVLGIKENTYSINNAYNIIILGKIKSYDINANCGQYNYYAFSVVEDIFAGPFEDFSLSSEGHLITIKKGNLYGVMNCYGLITIPFGKYSWIDSFHGGYVRARFGQITNGQNDNDANWCLLNYRGEEVYSNCYDIYFDKVKNIVNIQQKKNEAYIKVRLYEKFDYIKITDTPTFDWGLTASEYNRAAREQIADAYE